MHAPVAPVAPVRPTRDPLPSVIEFEEEGQEHTVVVKRRSGELVTLHGALRYGSHATSRTCKPDTATQAQAKEAPDRATRKRLAAEQLAVEEDLCGCSSMTCLMSSIGSLDPAHSAQAHRDVRGHAARGDRQCG